MQRKTDQARREVPEIKEEQKKEHRKTGAAGRKGKAADQNSRDKDAKRGKVLLPSLIIDGIDL